MQPRLLIVEDDDLIGESLQRALNASGYSAERVATLGHARTFLLGETPDLILLDLTLPDGDGLDLCGEVQRTLPRVPVVVLTARDSELDVVNGLNAGAVDFVVKPFRLAELLARVRSHLRYASSQSADTSDANHAGHTAAPGTIGVADLEINVGAYRVTRAGVELALRPKEFELLSRLARSVGEVVRREQLIEDVWDEHWFGSTKTLDVHINMLRQKLDRSGDASLITTVRGVGYRMEA